MTERIAIKPIRLQAPPQPLTDWSFWGADVGHFFACCCIVLPLRLYREHQARQVETPEAVPV
ncbi:hypothetical protein [Streptomyces mobaraensis]|uniref:Uncharacterized protein n=1 Tax=Streptomyces mobaraensis TaxID=35621 RepID=A0A5N5W3X6_STRMB|nr:hypothetical protein [Streptomyces mobaraensis]KAB7839510.1 hypothetical protein FRZ00_21480 [Streptomyces mobaraensis]